MISSGNDVSHKDDDPMLSSCGGSTPALKAVKEDLFFGSL